MERIINIDKSIPKEYVIYGMNNSNDYCVISQSDNSLIVDLTANYGSIENIPASEVVECKILTLKDNFLFIDGKTKCCDVEVRTLIPKTYGFDNRLR